MSSSDETYTMSSSPRATVKKTQESSTKRKRVLLPLWTKGEIVKRMQKGEPLRDLAEEYNLGYTTIRDLRDNSEKILRYMDNFQKGLLPINKKIMKHMKPTELEEKMSEWYKEQMKLAVDITDQMIKEKAIRINQEMGGDPKFSADAGWFLRFRNRHGIAKTKLEKRNSPRIKSNKVEEMVSRWYVEQVSMGTFVSDEMIGKMALHFNSVAKGDPKFLPDAAWMLHFKKRQEVAGSNLFKVPDLSERMGMEGTPPSSKMDGGSSYLTCSPLLTGMPGLHEDFMTGAGPSSSSHDPAEGGGAMHGDYEQEDFIDVKAEPVFNVSPEICEDENSQNNTQSSSDRPSSQSSPTPGMAGPYLLKKETHCTTILDQLLRDDTFSDVTLTAEGQSIRAHKIVLCLASAYFRQVLSKESTIQNVIVFRDIKFSELKNLINFIYTGEATVDAAELESFMKTAEMLEVNSLCEGQRNLPKTFLPRREPEQEKPRGSSSKRTHSQADNSSPPTKSRRVNDAPLPSKSSKVACQPSTSSSSSPSSGAPPVAPPPPIIKSEPLSVEDDPVVEEGFPAPDEEDTDFDSHAKSPSQSHDPGSSPRLSDGAAAERNPRGKCPFCPSPQPLRKGAVLTKHVHTCHPDQIFFCCDICSRVFVDKTSFETHKDDCNR